MRWCEAVIVFVVAYCSVVEVCLGEPQLHNAGVSLPTSHHQGATIASAATGSHLRHGVPLPATPGAPRHAFQGHGVSIPSAAAQSPSGARGVPLPAPTRGPAFSTAGLPLPKHPVVVVPLHQSHGVPLPRPNVFRGQGSPSFPVGVPLPPSKGVGAPGFDLTGSPSLIEGMAALKPVKNVQGDTDVQHAIRLAAVHDFVQLRTKADHAVKVTDVISAHKQLVSGQVLHLTLRVGETKCPIGTPNLHGCVLDLSEDDHICEVALWERPWLNSSKVIVEKSRCAEAEDDNDFNRWGPHALLPVPSSAEVTVQTLPRGVEEQQVGVEAFNYIDHGSESKFRGELIAHDLTSIKFDPLTDTTQMQVDVEYGFTLCLKSHNQLTDSRECPPDIHRGHYICSVVILHNPNQITSLEVIPILDDDDDIHCERKRNVGEELVVPVATPCSGCPHPAPLNDPTILEVADFALREYDRTSSDEDSLHIIVRLIKAYSQVVAGVRYHLTMELAESLCKKVLTGADVNRTFCSQDPTEESKICDLHVIDQPWIPARDLLSVRCYDRDSYTSSSHDEFIVPVSLGGGFGTAGPDTPLLFGSESQVNVAGTSLGAVKFVVDEYNRREDDHDYYKLVRVHEASSQAPGRGGRRHHVVVELGETRCRKGDPSTGTGEHCPLDPTEEHEVCEADIQEQPSQHNQQTFRILNFRCDDLDDYLRKKFMPTLSPSDVMDHPFLDMAADTSAGYQRVARNDSAVLHAAVFVADQYNLREDEDELYTLNRVVSSVSQSSPNGVRYHLEIELAETHCKKYQFVAAPSRCPVDHSEEMEVCQAEVLIPQTPGSPMQLIKLYCDEISDYYTRRIRGKLSPSGAPNQQINGGPGGVWMDVGVDDTALKRLGHLLADEYDHRSDESSLFIFHKVLKARKQIASGIMYQLVVELLETVCPKYKRRINKSRCSPDIGEDHVVCEAHVFSQPWLKRDEISHFRCAEKDDFFEGDESVEVLYPRVHPSAHARPVFRSHFVVRTSDESEESNERFYYAAGGTNAHPADTDEDDSDERRYVRGRRAIVGSPSSNGLPKSLVGELVTFALQSLDSNSSDVHTSGVKEILHAEMQEVSGNLVLELLVHSTTCLKNQQDLSSCLEDPTKPNYVCKFTLVEDHQLGGHIVDTMLCHTQEN
ncbi:Cystatin [Chionoecetes opilio]|uniref:Cystatin n=1 Tax=Chionoecetes opilio TaxID=41210 RepID=A0A8J4XSQ4_CHIOP|nr:Cystatin [Chionoecetes opilio]